MGQKVNPVGIRVGSFLPWKSRWFTDDRSFSQNLIEDIKIRNALMDRLKLAGVASIEIERLPKSVVVYITVSRPGIVIGRGGTGIEELKKFILDIIGSVRHRDVSNLKIDPRVNEIKNPELSSYLVATRIASELERRIPHRRVVNKTMERVMAGGAQGVKIVLGGRIGGAEISRVEKFKLGSVPAQTLRENIDYASVVANLKRGKVGIKAWIHKRGED